MRSVSPFIAVFVLASLGAAPATQPAVDKAHLQIDRPGCSIVIPKTWKVSQDTKDVVIYRLPAGAGGSGGTFIIVTAPLKGQKITLAEIVAGKKEGLTSKLPDTKITTDQAATLNGRDAWELVYDLPTQAKETDSINGKAGDAKTVVIHQIGHSFTSIGDDQLTELTYIGPKANVAAHEKEVKAVFESLRWK